VGFFLFFFFVFVGGVLCLFYLYDTCLWFCLFWACESLEVFGGPGHIFFLCGAPLCGMLVRYNLFERQPGVGGGAVQVFFLLGSVVVSTVLFI
jgi:hypothetical protein